MHITVHSFRRHLGNDRCFRLLFPHVGLNLCLRKHRSNQLYGAELHIDRQLKSICQSYLFGQVDPHFESCNILRQHLLRIHDKLKKMKKLSHVPCFSTSTAKPKSYRDKSQMFLRSRSVCCLLSHVIVDAIADPIPRILLVPNVVLNS